MTSISESQQGSSFDRRRYQCTEYRLAPTHMIPNSRYPLIHYRPIDPNEPIPKPSLFFDTARQNNWDPHWLTRYGETQMSHYHSYTHECMIVLNGTATIRFGAGDTTDDMHENTYGKGFEPGGLNLECKAGDVLVIPAGVSHKTHKTLPRKPFLLYSPGDGHGIPKDFREKMDEVDLEGFVMMGCYPKGLGSWDYALGAEGAMIFAHTWSVPPPARDPLFGTATDGILGCWTGPPGPYVEGMDQKRLEEKRDYGLHEVDEVE